MKTNSKDGKIIKGVSKADKITNTGNKVTIDGDAGDDFIYSAGEKVLINYSGGNDVYDLDYSFARGNGTIQIASGTMDSVVTMNGENFFLTVGKNKITLPNAAHNVDKVKIIDSKGKAIKYKINKKIVGSSGNDDIFNSLVRATISSGAGDDTICNLENNVSINGGKGNDYIYDNRGSKVTINGGSGDNTIDNFDGASIKMVGGDGNDVFIYVPGKGTDRIMDYESGDMLRILKADGNEGGSFKSSKFSGGDLTLTINGGGKIIFEDVSKGDKFNINGTIYTLGKTKLVK